jgi:hypothetical protein
LYPARRAGRCSISLHWPANTFADSSRLYSSRHGALDALDNGRHRAAVVLDLFGAQGVDPPVLEPLEHDQRLLFRLSGVG